MKKVSVSPSLTSPGPFFPRNFAVSSSTRQRAQTAAALAQEFHAVVKRVTFQELAGATSSETKKNLTRLLTAAKKENAVLFFDEADALFGKRSEVKDSHDRYANTETSYLLQKIEESQVHVVIGVRSRPAIDPELLKRWRLLAPNRTPPKPS